MNKKTIVITGSTRGIGYGLALEFLKQNHQLIINGTNKEKVEAVVSQLRQMSFDVQGVTGSITDESTFKNIIDKAVSNYKKIDIWINNAGIPQSQKYFYELPSKEIESLVLVNIYGLILGTQTAIKFFKQQGFGKIFNMEGFGSDGRMMQKLTLYGTSKRAVNYFTKSVSKEHINENIQIGILSPGMVRTDFLKNSMTTGTIEEQVKNKKVFDILAEEPDVVTNFLVNKILKSKKHYDRIEYLTTRKLIPKLLKLMFVK